MIGYFIKNPQSKFYESSVFTKVLNYMQKHPSEMKLSEKNDRLRLIVDEVSSIEKAFYFLTKLLDK